MSKNVLHTQQRLPNTRSNSCQVIGVPVDQDKKMSGIARASTGMGSHCQKMTQTFEKPLHPILLLLSRARKEVSSRIVICRSLACTQFCIYAAVCDWFDRHNQNQEAHRRAGPELSTEDFHEPGTPKGSNSLGKTDA